MAPLPAPWAILLCRYSDDANDPSITTIADLAKQWRATRDAAFIAANLFPAWDSDGRTLLEICQNFFTVTGLFTFNSVRFWDEYSHGRIYTGDSEVFPCVLNRTIAQGAARAMSPGGPAYQNETFVLAKKALLQQHGKNWMDYAAVAVLFQSPDFGAQGGSYDGGPGVFMDIRYVKNNGVQAWGQEMGHAFGLDHSRTDGVVDANGVPLDYTDHWDVMSTRRSWSAPDPSYGMRGPGLNAWNMRSRSWLDETRVWKPPSGDFSNVVVELRPLHKRLLPGYLAAELPGIGGHSAYLVEFRTPEEWDAAIGWPKVLVHRFEGMIGQFLRTHSYIMRGTAGQDGLGVGEVFQIGAGPFTRMNVLSIDSATSTARIQMCHSANPPIARTVKIVAPPRSIGCYPTEVEGATMVLGFELQHSCSSNYQIQWTVGGAALPPGTVTNTAMLPIILPSANAPATVVLNLMFDDGFVITDTMQVSAISEAEANWRHLICALLNERKKPKQWWEWDPAMVRKAAGRLTPAKYKLVEQRLAAIQRLLDPHSK